MPRFKSYDYNQSAMVVINFEEQLQPGIFEYAIHRLITDKLDLSLFYPEYNNDTVGRPAYDPAILLKIILFAYPKGITSSREIQWCCETNILFKALSCDTVTHFTTIASFVSSIPDKSKRCLNKYCWSAISKGYWAMNCLRSMAVNCHPMRRKNDRERLKNWKPNARSYRNKSITV